MFLLSWIAMLFYYLKLQCLFFIKSRDQGRRQGRIWGGSCHTPAAKNYRNYDFLPHLRGTMAAMENLVFAETLERRRKLKERMEE